MFFKKVLQLFIISNGNIIKKERGNKMPKYVIEREIPKIGDSTKDELTAIAQKSCSVLKQLGPQIQWVESFVTENKIYCIYISPNEELIREHGRIGGFPVTNIAEIKNIIDPTTSEI